MKNNLLKKIENIPVAFTSSDAIITFALTDGIIIEDATGAMKAQSYNWRYETAVKPGMKLTSLNAYWNFNQTIDYGYYVQEENYPGVLYSPDTEELTYTLGEESTVTYQSVTPAALVADYEGYKYKAVKIAKTTINTDESGNTHLKDRLAKELSISPIIALNKDKLGYIADMMGISWGALAGAFLAPFLFGLYWKRATKASVWASFIFGAGIMILNMLFLK